MLWPHVSCIGLKIAEVAHDMQAQVSRHVMDLGHVNSYDTWHGTYSTIYMCIYSEC